MFVNSSATAMFLMKMCPNNVTRVKEMFVSAKLTKGNRLKSGIFFTPGASYIDNKIR